MRFFGLCFSSHKSTPTWSHDTYPNFFEFSPEFAELFIVLQDLISRGQNKIFSLLALLAWIIDNWVA
jgi:hypothetical protein